MCGVRYKWVRVAYTYKGKKAWRRERRPSSYRIFNKKCSGGYVLLFKY